MLRDVLKEPQLEAWQVMLLIMVSPELQQAAQSVIIWQRKSRKKLRKISRHSRLRNKLNFGVDLDPPIAG